MVLSPGGNSLMKTIEVLVVHVQISFRIFKPRLGLLRVFSLKTSREGAFVIPFRPKKKMTGDNVLS